MVKHIILWKLRSELSETEKREKALAIKQGLESLKGQVPGLIDIHVQIDGRLETSNADIMLDSTLESFDALKGYAVHPAHLAVANGVVRPNTELRTCLDFEIWYLTSDIWKLNTEYYEKTTRKGRFFVVLPGLEPGFTAWEAVVLGH